MSVTDFCISLMVTYSLFLFLNSVAIYRTIATEPVSHTAPGFLLNHRRTQ